MVWDLYITFDNNMSQSYKILGVDPGTNITGYAIIEVENTQFRLLTAGIFDLRKFDSHQEKLKEIYLQIQEVIETYLPKEMAIEAPFYGKNVQSMLKLGRAQGVAMAAAITMGVKIFEYSPKKIKMSITGNGNASKEQVYGMLQGRMQISLDEKFLDASDALGAAVCHYQQFGVDSNRSSKKYRDWKSYISNNREKIV